MPYAGVGLGTVWTQFQPPKNSASFTVKDLPRQNGNVFVVTGGSSGIGFLLTKVLYGKGGKIYILTRSRTNAQDAMQRIKSSFTNEAIDSAEIGGMEFIHMDLEDLASVQSAGKEFLQKETRLDMLFNNAGIAYVTGNRKTKQGIEYHLGVNSVGHVLLEKLLRPALVEATKTAPKGSVRVIWPASILVELGAPKGGIRVDELDNPRNEVTEHYSASKAAMWFAASEISRRTAEDTGILNIGGNPGSHVTNSWRTTPWYFYYPFRPLLRDPIHGVETYLWMAFSNDVTMDDAVRGRYAMCDGRWHPGQRPDLLLALRRKEEGGTGQAAAYLDWCERKIAPFANM
jgi:NAD(P)-dependent dehydrogenase (short-subunit alcohol dehydrogenase family)